MQLRASAWVKSFRALGVSHTSCQWLARGPPSFPGKAGGLRVSGREALMEQQQPDGGRMPPQNVEVERQVLGACLVDNEAIPRAAEILRGDPQRLFYHRAHAVVWQTLLDLIDDGEPADQYTVEASLRRNGRLDQVGGLPYIVELTGRAASGANVAHHAKIVCDAAQARSLISVGAEMIRSAYDGDDVQTSMSKAMDSLYSLQTVGVAGGYRSARDAALAAMVSFREAKAAGGTVQGVPSGLTDLDEVTAGFQKGDLILLAGRPSSGKSAAAHGIARYAAQQGIPVGIVSLEMSTVQIGQRLLSHESGENLHHIRTGRADEHLLEKAVRDASGLPIWTDDTVGVKMIDIRARARALQRRHKIGLFLVDYLQLVDPDEVGDSSEREVSAISRALKHMAKELNTPVVALSQLSRASQARKDKRPELSDLRSSGSLEQDADVVIFVHRPEQWHIVKEKGTNRDLHGIAELIVAKQRQGPCKTVEVQWCASTTQFRDLAKDASHYPPKPEEAHQETMSWYDSPNNR
uniref:DNA 5'-3' helicase n=1 Tax=viral metagenome TaxID=1070528 RepID=A0A6M3J2J6_9ZZZZ